MLWRTSQLCCWRISSSLWLLDHYNVIGQLDIFDHFTLFTVANYRAVTIASNCWNFGSQRLPVAVPSRGLREVYLDQFVDHVFTSLDVI